MNMYYVYVLKSKKNGKRYIGSTKKLPKERLLEHNYGSSEFTKKTGPYELIYFEKCDSKEFAQKREVFFKSGNGRKFLKKKLAADI